MMLRDYQQRTIDQLYDWFDSGKKGNPCIVLPTGSGKSHVIAALVKSAVQAYEGTRILMLVHSKELIEQNAEKLRQHWPDAPLGIYSASLGKRELGRPVVFAGIQSVRNKAPQLGRIDLCIVDECHTINATQTGGYRKLIAELTEINPLMRVIGLTASPYRLGHGMIHQGDEAIFSDLIEPVSIEELVTKGHLCPLRSKHTQLTYSTDGVKKSAGDFVAKALEEALNTKNNNERVVAETIARAADRRSWLVFCAGVEHSQVIADMFAARGIAAACLTGGTPMQERERIIRDFKAGKIRVLTNVNVLTTGFDHTGIDCIVFLRPTMSPGLYYQMAGRGLRVAEGKADCLVLDFAGNVAQHGPITGIQPPRKAGAGTGEPITKTCPDCSEVIARTATACPACGFSFARAMQEEEEDLSLRNDDIMKTGLNEMTVRGWKWIVHTSRSTGKTMLKVTYYGRNLSDAPVHEYFTVMHDGFAGERARKKIAAIATVCRIDPRDLVNLHNASVLLQQGEPPESIKYVKNGSFEDVKHRVWAT